MGGKCALDIALSGIGAAAILVAVMESALVLPGGWPAADLVLAGPLIVLAGVSAMVGALQGTQIWVLVAVGTVLATMCFAVVVHLLHAFPSGRLHGAASR